MSDELDLVYAEQFRATELQVYNWGTFQGIHRMAIAKDGHLIVGASGAGKSSLLDAIATLLVPLRLHDLNAAARDQERKGKDRSVASYVRGAFSQGLSEDSGEILTRFLRPEATWSALAMGFDNGRGRCVTLAQILWIRGSGTKNADLDHLYFVFDRPFSLSEFASFDLDPRKLRKCFPDVFCESEFAPYQERFMRDLGIESVNALKLLHKTQSAKNLGDLNSFLRDFMLDEPTTFEAAKGLVEEFGRLDEAHRVLIDARRQIELLSPARAALERLGETAAEAAGISDILSRMDEWVGERKIELYRERLAERNLEAEKLEGLLASSLEIERVERRALEDLDTRYREEGGAALESWERELAECRAQRERRGKALEMARQAMKAIGREFPETSDGFAELRNECRSFIESWQDQSGPQARRQAKRDALRDELIKLREKDSAARRELEAMKRQRSNIPSHFLERRRELAAASGILESSLPFVGELMEVPDGESAWAGALERVLRGFSLSLLVSDADWPKLARTVDERSVGFRLVYYRVPELAAAIPKGPRRKDSLPGKLELKECRWKTWIENELGNRFNYSCVDSLKAMGDHERAVTKAGQIKHSRERFEKDDRYDISDRRNWTLGYTNEVRVDLFRQTLREVGDKIEAVSKSIRAVEEESELEAGRVLEYSKLSSLEWSDIDLYPIVERIIALEKAIVDTKKEGGNIAELDRSRKDQRTKVGILEGKIRELKVSIDLCGRGILDDQSAIRKLEGGMIDVFIPVATREAIENAFRENQPVLEIETIDGADKRIRQRFFNRQNELASTRAKIEGEILATFGKYKDTWKLECNDLEASIEGAPEFMSRLDKLELEDLPSHERRFADYLHDQSYKHLTELSTRIDHNRREIRNRMNIVNDSLKTAAFGVGTTLRIDTVERQSPEVQEFRATLNSIKKDALERDKEDEERRFELVRQLVDRLKSPEGAAERWRALVLDVRNHVEFVAHEVNADGGIAQSYRSGAGKSGGQRQRLATTCLAAALRYQLGGSKQGLPRFAMVSMDEAFDKADNEFTARIMEIFRNFGFQMIMATPNKAVMSLEPFIGGACYVGIKDERSSQLLPIAIDRASGRLDIFVRRQKGFFDAQEPT